METLIIIYIIIYIFFIIGIFSSIAGAFKMRDCFHKTTPITITNSIAKKNCLAGGLLFGSFMLLLYGSLSPLLFLISNKSSSSSNTIEEISNTMTYSKQIIAMPLLLISGAALAILFSGLALSEVISDSKNFLFLIVVSIIILICSSIIIILSIAIMLIGRRLIVGQQTLSSE